MSTWQIFRWPTGIALLTTFGLVSGLVSDGWGDAVAAAGLFAPAAVTVWFYFGGRRHRRAAVSSPSNGPQQQHRG